MPKPEDLVDYSWLPFNNLNTLKRHTRDAVHRNASIFEPVRAFDCILLPSNNSWRYFKRFKIYHIDIHTDTSTNGHIGPSSRYTLRYAGGNFTTKFIAWKCVEPARSRLRRCVARWSWSQKRECCRVSVAVRRVLSQRSLVRSFVSVSCLSLVTPPSLDADPRRLQLLRQLPQPASTSFRWKRAGEAWGLALWCRPARRLVSVFRFTGH